MIVQSSLRLNAARKGRTNSRGRNRARRSQRRPSQTEMRFGGAVSGARRQDTGGPATGGAARTTSNSVCVSRVTDDIMQAEPHGGHAVLQVVIAAVFPQQSSISVSCAPTAAALGPAAALPAIGAPATKTASARQRAMRRVGIRSKRLAARALERQLRSICYDCNAAPEFPRVRAYSAARRSRSALVTTETEDRLIAAAATIGLNSQPNAG